MRKNYCLIIVGFILLYVQLTITLKTNWYNKASLAEDVVFGNNDGFNNLLKDCTESYSMYVKGTDAPEWEIHKDRSSCTVIYRMLSDMETERLNKPTYVYYKCKLSVNEYQDPENLEWSKSYLNRNCFG